MPLSDFGPFADVFSKGELAVPGHLELLGLHTPTAQVVFDRIERALAAGDPGPWLSALFGEANWRPHLVGAVALLLDGGGGSSHVESLWRAADSGSWVIPQLVVTALFVDPDFAARARSRVEGLCPVRVPHGLSLAERHSATGPGNERSRSAKLLAALLSVGARLPSLAHWIGGVRAKPEVAALLADDIDDAPAIADIWLGHLVAQFARRGRLLNPRAG